MSSGIVGINFNQRETNAPKVFAYYGGNTLLGFTSSVRRDSIGNRIADPRSEIDVALRGMPPANEAVEGVGHIILSP